MDLSEVELNFFVSKVKDKSKAGTGGQDGGDDDQNDGGTGGTTKDKNFTKVNNMPLKLLIKWLKKLEKIAFGDQMIKLVGTKDKQG